MRPLKTSTLAISSCCTLLFLSACGQSGPLYIPGNPSTMAVPPENSQPEDSEEQQDAAATADDKN